MGNINMWLLHIYEWRDGLDDTKKKIMEPRPVCIL